MVNALAKEVIIKKAAENNVLRFIVIFLVC
jgi:hypothetical protein